MKCAPKRNLYQSAVPYQLNSMMLASNPAMRALSVARLRFRRHEIPDRYSPGKAVPRQAKSGAEGRGNRLPARIADRSASPSSPECAHKDRRQGSR